MSEHALLAPSSAHRWVFCPGSVLLCQQYPELEPSPSSLEGTAAHWVAQQALMGLEVTATVAPNGVEITEEMLDAVDVYVENIRAVQATGGAVTVESRVEIPRIHPEHNWGTPDASHYYNYVLTLWDFKFGHRHVDAFENWQMIDYTAGLLDRHPETREVRIRVVQPRNFHRDGPIREWVITPKDLSVYFEVLRRSAEKAFNPDKARCFPNAGCRNCSAARACDALRNTSLFAIDVSGKPMATDLPDDALGLELRLLDHTIERLEARRLGLAEQAIARVKGGHDVSGYTLESSPGRKRWSKPVGEVLALGEMMGIDLAKPGVLTPAQAVKAGLPEELLGAYSERPMGEAKLVASDVTVARKVFGK